MTFQVVVVRTFIDVVEQRDPPTRVRSSSCPPAVKLPVSTLPPHAPSMPQRVVSQGRTVENNSNERQQSVYKPWYHPMSATLAANLAQGLHSLSVRLSPAHGCHLNRVGHKMKSCYADNPPSHAVRFHDLLWPKTKHMSDDEDADSGNLTALHKKEKKQRHKKEKKQRHKKAWRSPGDRREIAAR